MPFHSDHIIRLGLSGTTPVNHLPIFYWKKIINEPTFKYTLNAKNQNKSDFGVTLIEKFQGKSDFGVILIEKNQSKSDFGVTLIEKNQGKSDFGVTLIENNQSRSECQLINFKKLIDSIQIYNINFKN